MSETRPYEPVEVMAKAKVSRFVVTTSDGYGHPEPLPAREIAENMLAALKEAGYRLTPPPAPNPGPCSYCKAAQSACATATRGCCVRCSDSQGATHSGPSSTLPGTPQ
jgi:hypothetical protein